jgi:hypothetical protein
MVRSRSLLSHSLGSLDHEIDVTFLEQINGLAAIEPIVRLRKEIQNSPWIVGR